MTLVLDSGAFVALERNDRAMWRRLKTTLLSGDVPVSHGGIVGQVWRGRGARHALLAKALAGVSVRAINDLTESNRVVDFTTKTFRAAARDHVIARCTPQTTPAAKRILTTNIFGN